MSNDEPTDDPTWPPHWGDDDKLADLHARYHDQTGNMIGKTECGWHKCGFWDSAAEVLAAPEISSVAARLEAVTTELAEERRRAANLRHDLAQEIDNANAVQLNADRAEAETLRLRAAVTAIADDLNTYREAGRSAPWVSQLRRAVLGGTESRPRRYDRCDATCTTDCGHCKGAGRPNLAQGGTIAPGALTLMNENGRNESTDPLTSKDNE